MQRPSLFLLARQRHFLSSKHCQTVRCIQNWSTSRDDAKFQFKCTQCGKCCTGKGGRVRLNGRECDEMAHYLKISRVEFIEKFTNVQFKDADGFWMLKLTSDDTQCIFLDGTKCLVYPVRPTQCRTFPWWPQHLISDYDWRLAARNCEGITVSSCPLPVHSDLSSVNITEILPETITYNIHQSGENFTYNELKEMLSDLSEADPSYLDDYKKELSDRFHRNVVYHDDDVTVLDTFLHGDDRSMNRTRCLVFNDRLHLIQSEMPLGGDVGDALVRVDPSQLLVLDVHRAMCVPFAWLDPVSSLRVAILGSGAGSLSRFLLHNISMISQMDAVEPNPIVNRMAREYFGLIEEEERGDRRFTLHEMDGETFVASHLLAQSTFDCILIDVESGESEHGSRNINVLAPPASMLNASFLESVDTLLDPHGILAVNVIATDEISFQQVAKIFTEVFGGRYVYLQLPNNYVLYVLGTSFQFTVDTLQDMARNNSLVRYDIEQHGGIRQLSSPQVRT